MKRKKNILEEAADKVLEQYDDREFLEKIRAERGPSIIAAQKERKMYHRRTWCYTAVASLVVAMITIMCCFYAFNNDESAENNNYYGAMQYLDSSYEEVNNSLNGIKINEIEQVKIIKGEYIEPKETVAYYLFYNNKIDLKSFKIVVDVHSKWEYASIDLANYNQTAEIQGYIIYYCEEKNEKNSFISKAYLQIDNIKIHFEYTENSNNEVSDFLNTIEMFIG